MPGLTFRIHADVSKATAALDDFARKQVPFAQSFAVNDLAFQVMRGENAATAKVFKHPRPFTQKAFQVETRATKASPFAKVSLRANRAYVAPYETGGMQITPGKLVLDPVDARVDPYGQLPKGTAKRLAARKDVFVGTVRGILGFWQRTPKDGLRLLIRLTKPARVQPKLGFYRRAGEIVRANGAMAVQEALAKAMGSARR